MSIFARFPRPYKGLNIKLLAYLNYITFHSNCFLNIPFPIWEWFSTARSAEKNRLFPNFTSLLYGRPSFLLKWKRFCISIRKLCVLKNYFLLNLVWFYSKLPKLWPGFLSFLWEPHFPREKVETFPFFETLTCQIRFDFLKKYTIICLKILTCSTRLIFLEITYSLYESSHFRLGMGSQSLPQH